MADQLLQDDERFVAGWGGVAPVGPGDAAGPAADRAPYYPNDFTPCRYDPAQLIADLEDAQAARMNDDDKLTFLYAADAVSIAGAEERISRAGLSCGWTVTNAVPRNALGGNVSVGLQRASWVGRTPAMPTASTRSRSGTPRATGRLPEPI